MTLHFMTMKVLFTIHLMPKWFQYIQHKTILSFLDLHNYRYLAFFFYETIIIFLRFKTIIMFILTLYICRCPNLAKRSF
jgi:uncharacterized membrane protein YesL